MEFGGKYYVAKWWTSNSPPGQEWGDWEYFGSSCNVQDDQKDQEEEDEEDVEDNEIPDDIDHSGPHGPPSKKVKGLSSFKIKIIMIIITGSRIPRVPADRHATL